MSCKRAFTGLLTALVSSSAVAAVEIMPLGPARTVRIADLIGRTPTEVLAALAGPAIDRPTEYAFEMLDQGGRIGAIRLADLVMDGAAREIQARVRSKASGRLPSAWTQCAIKFADDTAAADVDDVYLGRLIFQGGRLARILAGPPTRVVAAMPGPGSLAQGASALDGWGEAVAPSRGLTSTCTRQVVVADPPDRRSKAEGAWNPQDIAGLPFVFAMPFRNAHRVRAQRDGLALYESLSPGTRVTPEESGSGLVRTFNTAERSYAVLRVDMGAYPGLSIDDTDDYALVGVRNGVVVWRAREPAQAGVVLRVGP